MGLNNNGGWLSTFLWITGLKTFWIFSFRSLFCLVYEQFCLINKQVQHVSDVAFITHLQLDLSSITDVSLTEHCH